MLIFRFFQSRAAGTALKEHFIIQLLVIFNCTTRFISSDFLRSERFDLYKNIPKFIRPNFKSLTKFYRTC